MSVWRYLLDTNSLSDLARQPDGEVARTLLERGPDTVCTSIIVAAELRFGACKKSSPRLTHRIQALLDTITVLPLAPDADHHYGQIRVALERQGAVIGPNDLLIAAHARSQGLIVVSENTREFSRVPDLRVENWRNRI